MQRREMFGKAVAGMAALAGSSVVGVRPALSDHRLAPAAHRLDNATEALLTAMVETAHHQEDDDQHEANDELLAVMAAGALQGQARAIHELIEAGNPDANVLLAGRELDRQLRVAQQRILHAHSSQIVRTRFRSVRASLDDFLAQAGGRGYGRGYYDNGRSPYDRDRYDNPRNLPNRDDRDDDHDH